MRWERNEKNRRFSYHLRPPFASAAPAGLLTSLPPRIPASLVCKLAGYGKAALNRRIKDGLMPAPIDRGRENLFLTSEVLKRLGLAEAAPPVNPFEKALDDFGAS